MDDVLASLRLSGSLRESLERATTQYESQITAEVASYLTGRGIGKAVATGHRLGFVGEPCDVAHEEFVGRLAIPYLSPSGVVAMTFRCLIEHDHGLAKCPKYLNWRGLTKRLYNVRDLHRPEPYVAICEGEIDTIVMSSLVGIPAVGLAGGDGWRPHYPRIFADFDKVFVVMDNDDKENGENPGEQFQRKVVRDLPQAVSIRPPRGFDVNEWYLSLGAAVIREAMGL